MAKLSMKQFSDWLGYDPETVSSAIEIVRISDSDGAYTHAQDMGEDEMAEVIEAIYFEHGSLKDAIQACKEDLGLIEENTNKMKTQKIKLSELRQLVKGMLKENKLNIFYVVFDGTSHIVLDEYNYRDFIKNEPKEYHKILFKSNNEDKAFNKAEELNEPKTQKIKLSELRQLVKGMLKEGNEKTPLEYIKYGKEDFLEEDMYSISYYAYDSLKKKNCILTISKTPGSSWDYNIEYK
jgi:hypothetical protein